MNKQPTLTKMSLREYAATKNVSDTAIRKQRGKRLSEACFVIEDGKVKGIYKELADVDWVNNFNANYERTVKGTDKDTGKKKTNIETLTDGTGSSKNFQDMQRTRKLLGDIELQTAAIKLQELKGVLVKKDKVYEALFNFGAELRTKLQELPDNTLDHILAAGSREEAYDLFTAAIDQVLSKLSNVNQSVQL